MKHNILIIGFLLTASVILGQKIQDITTFGYNYKRVKADTLLGIPSDTLIVPTVLKPFPWLARKTNILYIWSTTNNKWEAVGTGVTDGDKGDITVSGSGTVFTIDNQAVTLAKMQDLAGLSVLGRAPNSTGVMAAITAASDNTVLLRSGTSLTFATVPNAGLTNSAITINGTSVSLGGTRTLILASADFINQGTTTTVLHGNAAGNPSWGAVNLSTDVTGDLPLSSLAQFGPNTVAVNATTGTADLTGLSVGLNNLVGRGSTGNVAVITVGGILSFSGTVLSATEVDGSTSNELQTIAVTGSTTGITTLSNGGGSMTIAGAGINTVGVAGSTITITGTEVDGSVSNELQTISNTSDATSHTATLSNSGGSIQLVEGTGITLTTTGTGLNGIVTIASSGGASGANPTAQVGLTAVNGVAVTFLRSDGAPALDVTISPTWTGTHTFRKAGITSTTDAVILDNNTAATAGVQQWTPRIRLTGQGWKTNATAGSQAVDWTVEGVPVQGAANPTSYLVFSDQVNAAGYTGNLYLFSSGGVGIGSATDPAAAGVLNVSTGYRIGNAAAVNTVLKGNGTNYVSGTMTLASADFANQGTTTTVLHGNAAGNPSWGAISLTADVSGDLPLSSLAQFGANTVATNATTGTADLSSTALVANNLLGRGSTGNIAAITVSGILSFSGTVLSATEVDGSVSNELQTISNTSDATSHTATLSNSGGSIQLIEGTNITLTTTGTGLNGIVTIASTGGGSGVTTVGALDGGTEDANGANISGTIIYMQSATATFPGLVTTTTQTMGAGFKTFINGLRSDGFDNTSTRIGNSALGSETGAGYNTAVGLNSGASLTNGTTNVAIGTSSLNVAKSGFNNIAIGANSLRFGGGTITAGSFVVNVQYTITTTGTTDFTLIGAANSTPGTTFVATGVGTGTGTATEYFAYNTAIGPEALTNNKNSYNTAIGFSALPAQTSGGNNTAIGSYAGQSITTGTNNIFIGYGGGDGKTTTDRNIIIGVQAGHTAGGGDNVLIGNNTGYSNSGGYNTYIGTAAGYSSGSGTNNIFIGYAAGYTETGSNKLHISQTYLATPLVYGEFDNSLFRINGFYEVKEQAAPATPGTGFGRLYAKSDNLIYWKNDAGAEFDLTATGGGGISDGDKGDITVSSAGTVWTIDNQAVTFAKIQNAGAYSVLANTAGTSGSVTDVGLSTTSLFGRGTTNVVGSITLGTNLSMSGNVLNASGGGGGVTTMQPIGSTPNANGATISGVDLTLQIADSVYGGLMSTGTQFFNGAKQFNDGVYWSTGSGLMGLLGSVTDGGWLYGAIRLSNIKSVNVGDLFTTDLTASRTYKLPNGSGTIALIDFAQTWTAVQTFSTAPVISTITNTGTITLPTITSTLSSWKESSITSNATLSPTGDARENFYDVTAQGVDITTISAPSGTPLNHNTLIFRLDDNGGTRLISGWNVIYRGGTNLSLPSTITLSKTIYIKFMYNTKDSKWDLISVLDGL